MKRLPMRKIREVLRLRSDGFSVRRVAQSLGLGRATISEYFRRADLEGLSWPLPADLSDGDLEHRLFPYSPGETRRAVPQPDWGYVHAELRRKGVTLSLLWEEYRGVHPDGYGYSRYCELYTRWEGKLSPVMRQRHPAGERLFVDYAGQTVDVICPKTGEVRTAQIYVATLAEAFTEMQKQDGTAALSHAEWLGLLIDRETASRDTKRFESRMRAAKLRHRGAVPEDVDYKSRRGLDKALFQQMLTGRWIKDKRNLMITGPCGVGKTWLACALAQAACRDGITVLYKRMPRLFDELELAHGDGRFPRLFKALTKIQLLILDDWGPDRLDASQRRDLMEIVEDRYEVGSTLITSQLPIDTWHDVIGEPTFADAILDRLVHNAYHVELDGQSMRKTKLKVGDESTQN